VTFLLKLSDKYLQIENIQSRASSAAGVGFLLKAVVVPYYSIYRKKNYIEIRF
jgi:hypothetical protein